MDVKAVIMAGGEGARLRPLTCDRPKPLVPVCNRPVMAYILDLLAQHGFQEVFVTLGYRPDAISTLFGRHYKGMRLHYVVEESPLGTAGSVAQLRGQLDRTFLVISGDGLTDVDLTRLLAFHRQSGAVATLGMARVQDPLEYGLIMTNRQGRIRRFLEKPGWGEVFSDTVNTGIYVLEPSALTGVPIRRSYDFSHQLFPALLQMDAPLYGTIVDGYWCDIGDTAAYLQANVDMLMGRLRFAPEGREMASGIWVARTASTPEGILVEGPALIGEGCRLAPGTRLEAGAVLGPGTATEPGAVLRRTVTMSGVQIGGGATLVGTVVCDGARLGAGVGAYEGAVVGAHCQVGDRATLSPGVRLWPKTEVAAGALVDCTLTQSPNWSGRLLRRGGLAGRLGADLFPENALRVGTAFASVLGGSGPLVIGSDSGAAATLLKQALICGAMAAGRGVWDAGCTISPVTAFMIRHQQAAGGIHVRASEQQARVVFYDGAGRPASRGLQRKLEQTCARQDFMRATPEAAGEVEYLPQAEQIYLNDLSLQLNLDLIRAFQPAVSLEGPNWPVLDRWLDRLRCRRVRTKGLKLRLDWLEATWSLVGASVEAMLALEIWLGARVSENETVPIPVIATKAVETLVASTGRRPVRVPQADWLPADPLLSLGRLLQWVARERLAPDDVAQLLPTAHTAVRTVNCPWEAKGRVMRQLLEQHAESVVDLVDGLRIKRADGWALLLPDPDDPVFRIYTEASDAVAAAMLADEYTGRLRELLGQ
jgi:mannose-1-phosphate guanylyltransferase/phosphomannomutase